MRRQILIAATVTSLSSGSLFAQPASSLSEDAKEFVSFDAKTIALTHVQLVDGTGAAPKKDQTIVIKDGEIAAVGQSSQVSIPEDADVLDLKGHTVIPGIVGLHDHTFYTTNRREAQMNTSSPRLYLASGVTTIRTTGSFSPYSEINMKRSIEDGESVGPRMHITGPYISGPAPGRAGATMAQVSTPDDARRVVAYWAEEGATWFKAYTRISRAELAAAIDEAHQRGLKFTGHICSVSFTEAVDLGIDNLEHGFFTNSDWHATKKADECPTDLEESLRDLDISSDEVQATIRHMVDNGVAMTSTLAVYELYVPGRPPLEDRNLQALSPGAREEYLAARAEIAAEAEESNMKQLFPRAQAFEYAFVQAGGLLAAGVDPTGNGGALPGFGDQRNYELLLEAEFTPVETLQIMTLNGAKVLGLEDQIGSVEPGKLADLVVIKGDPVQVPADIRQVVTVFKDGVGYDSQKLIESVNGQVGLQ